MTRSSARRRSPAHRGVVRPISIAPMMDRTDRHFRYLMRRISRHTLLYTEMVTTGAVLHGDRDRLLAYHPDEHPLALQLGGDRPESLAECARIAEDRGFDEVNLNVGCPSSRVQSGRFGVCLMLHPERVARAVEAMRAAVSIPVTVKHRIGVDHHDSYEHMLRFVDVVAEAGCDRFTVHARKAWLGGLSPKQNRNVPPLRHGDVHRLKRERPGLVVEINGGLKSLEQYRAQLEHVDAVMVGRAAWDHPWHFAEVDPALYGTPSPASSRSDVVQAMAAYTDEVCDGFTRPWHVARHLGNLLTGVPGAKAFRHGLAEACQGGRGDGRAILAAWNAAMAVQARTAA